MPTEKPAKKGRQGDARIQVSENGPYIVSGWIPLIKLTISTDVEGYPRSYVVGGIPSQRNVCSVPVREVQEQAILRWNARQGTF